MPHIRHLYPGGNTSRGFYSYYDQVIRPEAATRIFILKGGPGVGKSTLMRRLGEEIAEHRDVEFLHCSSDNDSLDGIVVPSAGVMMVDGTAPHIVDPVLPGAVDGIVNLGECLNQTALHEKTQQIFETNRRISSQFQRAYRYLAAAAQVRADAHALYAQHTDRAALNEALAPLIKSLKLPAKPAGPGRERKLFAGAVTPGGCVCTLESLKGTECWRLAGPWAFPAEWALEVLVRRALESGLEVETYHCAIDPERIEHLYLPEKGLLVTTDSDYHRVSPAGVARTLDFAPLIDQDALLEYQPVLQQNAALFASLVDAAVQSIATAKRFHDKLEHFYTSEMDYARLGRITDRVRAEVLALCGLA